MKQLSIFFVITFSFLSISSMMAMNRNAAMTKRKLSDPESAFPAPISIPLDLSLLGEALEEAQASSFSLENAPATPTTRPSNPGLPPQEQAECEKFTLEPSATALSMSTTAAEVRDPQQNKRHCPARNMMQRAQLQEEIDLGPIITMLQKAAHKQQERRNCIIATLTCLTADIGSVIAQYDS